MSSDKTWDLFAVAALDKFTLLSNPDGHAVIHKWTPERIATCVAEIADALCAESKKRQETPDDCPACGGSYFADDLVRSCSSCQEQMVLKTVYVSPDMQRECAEKRQQLGIEIELPGDSDKVTCHTAGAVPTVESKCCREIRSDERAKVLAEARSMVCALQKREGYAYIVSDVLAIIDDLAKEKP